MPSAHARLSLVRAADDAALGSAALQAMFTKCRAFLRLRGVEAAMPMFYDDEERRSGYLGEIIVPIHHAVDPAIQTIVDAWFEGPAERAVRLRVGEMAARA